MKTCPEAVPLAAGFGDGSGVPNIAKPAEPFPVQPGAWGQSSSEKKKGSVLDNVNLVGEGVKPGIRNEIHNKRVKGVSS